jgi:hypothetical protein
MFASVALGQMAISPGRRTGAVASNSTRINLGVQVTDTNETGDMNVQLYFAVKTPAGTFHVDSCSVRLHSQGVAGKHLECGLYTANVISPANILCHGSYTETGATGDQVITIPLSGCGTLAGNTAYVIFENTDDSTLSYDDYNCGGSCSGANFSATMQSSYSDSIITYGTYPSYPSGAGAGYQFTEYITIH